MWPLLIHVPLRTGVPLLTCVPLLTRVLTHTMSMVVDAYTAGISSLDVRSISWLAGGMCPSSYVYMPTD